MKHMVIAALAASLLASCASMSKQECLSADWQQVGFADGSNGYAVSRLERHQKACAKVEIVPDGAAYLAAYQNGLKQYCTPHAVFNKALDGMGSVSVCPSEVQAGLRPYQRVPSDYLRARQRADDLQDRYERFEWWVYSARRLTDREYLYYLHRLSQLRRDVFDAQLEADRYAYQVRRMQQELQNTPPAAAPSP